MTETCLLPPPNTRELLSGFARLCLGGCPPPSHSLSSLRTLTPFPIPAVPEISWLSGYLSEAQLLPVAHSISASRMD